MKVIMLYDFNALPAIYNGQCNADDIQAYCS